MDFLNITFTAHTGQVVLRDKHQAVISEPNVLLHLLEFFAKEMPPTPVGLGWTTRLLELRVGPEYSGLEASNST